MQSRMILLVVGMFVTTQLWAIDMFQPVTRQTEFGIDHPATFYRIDGAAFSRARGLDIGASISIPLTLPNGNPVTLDLERFAVIDQRSTLTAMTSNGAVPIPAPESVLLRGRVRGVPSSNVVLAVYRDNVLGRMSIANGPVSTTYLMNTVSDKDQTVVLYDMRHVKRAEPWHCAVLDTGSVRIPSASKGERTQASYRTINLALEGDQPYYQDNGSNVTTATNYAEAVIAHVSDLYERDVNTVVYIGTFVLWTTPDPYPGTTTDEMLTQLRDYYRVNKQNLNRSVAMLFTGINNLGGIAYVDVLCDKNWGYGVSGIQSTFTYPRTTYAWDTEVTAHELGHNVGSRHTHSCTWNPPIDSCWYAEQGNCFTTRVARVGTIMSYCHLNGSIDLDFGARVEALMSAYIADAACLGYTSDIAAVALGDTAVCAGATVQLRASYSGGTGPYTFTWSPTTGMTNPTTLTPLVTPTTTTKYVFTVRDALSVEKSDTVTITVYPSIAVTMPARTTRCAGEPVLLQPTVTGGTAPFQYRWRDARGLDTTTTTAMLSFVPKGSGFVSLVVSDMRGCTRRDSVELVINPRPNVEVASSKSSMCEGDTVRLTAKITTGIATVMYRWFANGVRMTESMSSIVAKPAMNTTYTVVVTDPLGCTDTATIDVRVRQARLQIAPATITLPKLAFCETAFSVNPLLVNTGVDELRITEITASRLGVANPGLPIVIPPGQAQNILLNLTLDSSSSVRDTLRFRDESCQRTWEIVVVGQRGDIIKTPTAQTPEFGTALMCGVAVDTVASTISLTNSTAVAAQILRLNSRYGHTVIIPNASMTIGAQATRVLPISVIGAFPIGYTDDTIDVVVRSLGCERTFSYPVTYGADGLTVTTVKEIDFGEVRYDGPSDHATTYDVEPRSEAIAQAYVTELTITGPFTTTMRRGMRLPVKQATTFTARFNTRERPEGEHLGAIEFKLDNCADVTRIPLRAKTTTVGVDDEQSLQPLVYCTGGRIIIAAPTFMRAMIYDLRGERVATASLLEGAQTAISDVAPGAYAVVLMRDDDVVRVATVIVSRN